MTRPTCASCRYYHAPEAADDLPERARAAQKHLTASDNELDRRAGLIVGELLRGYSVGGHGQCRMHPSAVYKRPSDWCGQHQTPNGGRT